MTTFISRPRQTAVIIVMALKRAFKIILKAHQNVLALLPRIKFAYSFFFFEQHECSFLQVTKFCDNDRSDRANLHNKEAPNKHNRLCDYRSAWEVMRTTADLASMLYFLYKNFGHKLLPRAITLWNHYN